LFRNDVDAQTLLTDWLII